MIIISFRNLIQDFYLFLFWLPPPMHYHFLPHKTVPLTLSSFPFLSVLPFHSGRCVMLKEQVYPFRFESKKIKLIHFPALVPWKETSMALFAPLNILASTADVWMNTTLCFQEKEVEGFHLQLIPLIALKGILRSKSSKGRTSYIEMLIQSCTFSHVLFYNVHACNLYIFIAPIIWYQIATFDIHLFPHNEPIILWIN